MGDEIERLRCCITMAMGCLDPLSKNPDERLAWYRLHDALNGKEARTCLTYDNDTKSGTPKTTDKKNQ